MTDQQAYIIIAIIFTVGCLIPYYWPAKYPEMDPKDSDIIFQQLADINSTLINLKREQLDILMHVSPLFQSQLGMNDYNHKAFGLLLKEIGNSTNKLEADILEVKNKFMPVTTGYNTIVPDYSGAVSVTYPELFPNGASMIPRRAIKRVYKKELMKKYSKQKKKK